MVEATRLFSTPAIMTSLYPDGCITAALPLRVSAFQTSATLRLLIMTEHSQVVAGVTSILSPIAWTSRYLANSSLSFLT